MPRPPNAIPPREIHVNMPENIAARLDRLLWSELENRVPYGARSGLINTLVENYLNIVCPEAT